MSKYLKLFETTSEYETYINGSDKVLPNVSFCEDERGIHYSPYVEPPHDYSQDYFTMIVTTGGDVTWTGTSNNALYYSKNDEPWSSTAYNNITLTVAVGDKVLWKGTTTPSTSYPNRGIGNFSGSAEVRYTVEGNAMSLLFGDDFKEQTSLEDKKFAFNSLFKDNINITSAENLSLPATTLTDGCYGSMFQGCTSLTTAPELPATTLVQACYNTMFQGCTSLTTAPELPATKLAGNCYMAMFKDCTSLSSIKCLATNIKASTCTFDWVNGVAASGTFTKTASMSSWTTGTAGIPSGWTVQDAA